MSGRERAANQSVSVRDIFRRPLFPLGFIIVFGAAVYAGLRLYQSQVIIPWNELLREKTNTSAEVLTEQLETRLGEIENRLAAITENQALITALANDDSLLLEATKSHLLDAWPELHELIIVPKVFEEQTLGDNFIAINLLNHANAGEQLSPVARRIDKAWYIQLSRAVIAELNNSNLDNSNIVGSVLVSLPIETLADAISTNQSGLIEIRQHTKRFAPQTLWSHGSDSSDLKQTLPIKNNPAWQLRYVAPASLRDDTAKPLKRFLASVAALALLTGLLIWLLFLAVKQALGSTRPKPLGPTVKPGDLSPGELNTLVQEKQVSAQDNKGKREDAEKNHDVTDHEEYPSLVFRDYDIRGQADSQITKAFALALGKTVGTKAVETSQSALIIAMDGRTTSPALKQALAEGVLSTGCNVIDLGLIPTPAFNFGLQTLDGADSGLIVTASHNPPGDNGFKLIFEQRPLSSGEITELASAMKKGRWVQGNGELIQMDIEESYIGAITNNVSLSRPIRLVVDCGNGAMGSVAPRALEALGCEVTQLHCDIDGNFPNHDPDPSDPRNLEDLISIVRHQQADLGLAFDGDGDRLVAVSGKGRIVWPDELLMIFARDALGHQPGANIVFDVKSTRRLPNIITAYGGQPILSKTGHSNIRRKIQDTNAILGGEYSGHIFFNDRWFGFDDGLYAAARLIEILDIREQSLDDILTGFESSVSTQEIKLAVPDTEKFALMDTIASETNFDDGEVTDIDGLRVEFADGWGLIRASNTSANLTMRFEAENRVALDRIQDCFKTQIGRIVPNIELPF